MNGMRVALAVLVAWAVLALVSPLLPLQPNEMQLGKILAAPDGEAFFGHDDLGRSIGDRLVVGARTSFLVAFAVVALSAAVGTLIGTMSGFAGGRWDRFVLQIIDVFLAFPGILLAIALAGILGPGIENVVFALTVVGWTGFARLARAQTLSVKHREHLVAARALGTGLPRILLRHLLPLISAPLMVEMTFGIASIVIAEAGLSFLGLGVQPPEASWGSMIRDGSRYLLVAPHMVIVPGMALIAVILCVNLVGDRLRDRLDVRLARE